MIPMPIASASPPNSLPAAGRAGGAHPEAGGRAADDTTAFSLAETQVPAPPEPGADMGLVHAADVVPARAGHGAHGDHGAHRWGEPDPAGARSWPTTDHPATADPKADVTPATGKVVPTPDQAPQPTDRDQAAGGPAKAGPTPLAHGPAAALPASAAQGAKSIAAMIPQAVPAPSPRHGYGRVQHPADHAAASPAHAQTNGPTVAQIVSTEAPGRTDAPAAATVTPFDPVGPVPDGGGDPGMSAREADPVRADPARGDSLRSDQPRADVARAAGNQLVEAVRHGPNGNTEVALNPEELGRVRLGLNTQDGALHVSIMAERPETQDMLRRHIGQLQEDFRALGYTDVTFDFGPGGEQSARQPLPETPITTPSDGTDPGRTGGDITVPAAAEVSRFAGTTARLDLRI